MCCVLLLLSSDTTLIMVGKEGNGNGSLGKTVKTKTKIHPICLFSSERIMGNYSDNKYSDLNVFSQFMKRTNMAEEMEGYSFTS